MITSALVSTVLFINLTLLSGPELKSQVDDSVFRLSVMTARGPTFGTGFLISETGLMVTNNHVIEGAIEIAAEDDGKVRIPVQAGYYARDSVNDLALIQLDLSKAPLEFVAKPLTLAKDTTTFVGGEDVYALGHPNGVRVADFSRGGLTAVIPASATDQRRLRFNAPITFGSSGSPLFDGRNGEVIGIVTSFHTSGQELNYATPVEYLHPMLASLDASPRLLPFRTPPSGEVAISSSLINLMISLVFFIAVAFGLRRVLRAAEV